MSHFCPTNCQKSPNTPRLPDSLNSCRWLCGWRTGKYRSVYILVTLAVLRGVCVQRGRKSSLFIRFLWFTVHTVILQQITWQRFSYFLSGSLLWPTDWTIRSNSTETCLSLFYKMSCLEYFYLFGVNYQYLRHRSLFAKSVICIQLNWGLFLGINHKKPFSYSK